MRPRHQNNSYQQICQFDFNDIVQVLKKTYIWPQTMPELPDDQSWMLSQKIKTPVVRHPWQEGEKSF